jgi:tRNA nucleotidyltransferase (CCA-adding enzyme)
LRENGGEGGTLIDGQAAVKTKVSRERIGIEIGKMLSPSKDPLRALTLIDQLHLHSSIFTIPPTPACPVPVSPPREDSLRSAQILSHVSQRKPFSEWIDSHLWLAAALEPFRGLTWKGKKEMHAVSAVISEDLKVGFTSIITRLRRVKARI